MRVLLNRHIQGSSNAVLTGNGFIRKVSDMKLRSLLLTLALALGLNAGAFAQAPFVENFDNVAGLAGAGWFFQNNSVQPDPSGAWRQAVASSSLNPPPSGANGSFAISSYFASASGSNTGANLNDWMLTPALALKNGDVIRFFTRTNTGNGFPERLQVRLSLTGSTTNVGTTDQDFGAYTQLLLDINPALDTGWNAGAGIGYPDVWTQFTITLSGLSGTINSRIAFRHVVQDSGAFGDNGNDNGIDSLSVTFVAVPEPATVALAGSVLMGGLFFYRRQRQMKLKAMESKLR